MADTIQRRTLRFEAIDAVLAEAERLVHLEHKGWLDRAGNWPIGLTLGHLATWADFAEAIFEEAGLDTRVRRISTSELGRPAPRPAYSVLRSERGAPTLPHWREGLRETLAAIRSSAPAE